MPYAIAIDLGTTTLAASLLELPQGRRIAMVGSLNPQIRFGADLVSRLDAALSSSSALAEMSRLIRGELLRLSRQLCQESAVPWSEVRQVAIAGNPAMQHLLMGWQVENLAFPPYRPLSTGSTRLAAAELEWDGQAEIYLFPMPGGFVGGDTVAFLYGQDTGTRHEARGNSPSLGPRTPNLYLDMGTNGEMALVVGETIWATSAAAGPAFEGGNLSCGMAALPGAVSSVRIEGERVRLATIGNLEPAGICGSAAIEAVSELLALKIIERGGRLLDPEEINSNLAVRVIRHRGENAFVLYRSAGRLLLLTQTDIRQIQLAKAAIRAGMEVLYDRSGISRESLGEVILTGSFGAVLRPEWLKSIGIFDEGMLHMISFTPEGALAGVERALSGADGFDAVERLADRFRVVPLSGTPLFETLFLQQIDFPAS
jgi:uncharacterized 2Fe-2S/4Fe-4S cluster protein (DUF4445 family)